MCYSLGVRSNQVVLLVGEVDVAGAKAAENGFNDGKHFWWCSMSNEHLECRGQRNRSFKGEKLTNGWPIGSTPGPWREWQETI
jgi:hypothetical protein